MKKYNATAYDRKKAKELLAQGYKYLAREEDGSLYAWQKSPRIVTDVYTFRYHSEVKNYWWSEGKCEEIQTFGFKFIKWEDKEPTLIADIIHGGRI